MARLQLSRCRMFLLVLSAVIALPCLYYTSPVHGNSCATSCVDGECIWVEFKCPGQQTASFWTLDLSDAAAEDCTAASVWINEAYHYYTEGTPDVFDFDANNATSTTPHDCPYEPDNKIAYAPNTPSCGGGECTVRDHLLREL